jgi:two-component system CheB/CheR fusion protein
MGDPTQASTALRPSVVPDAKPSPLDFPIVAIGASAGGLPALLSIFEHMPPSPGMAFVVVMHLSPEEQSTLDRILQKTTSMPVMQVRHSVPILPNQVYVIPPNSDLKVQGERLVLEAMERPHGRLVAIDVFFCSLAEACRERAFAIVLSGMGSDGTRGLACIKGHGGFAIAQDPAEAECDSMPQAAIASGAVDLTLPAAQMPAKLVELSTNARNIRLRPPDDKEQTEPASPPSGMTQEAEQTLQDILLSLRARTGHDFLKYRRATVMRRIERRMQVCAVSDLQGYLDVLNKNPSEHAQLLRDMLIGVTNFFRDREAFEALDRTALPAILNSKAAGDEVRAWVAACSTGEEAYSVAMMFAEQAELLAKPLPIQIFATDIDERALGAARAGRYSLSIESDVSLERLREHFYKEGNQYRIRKNIRDRILFATQNVLRDPPFSRMDLITCRNLLIYLNSDMQKQILETFYFALNPGGFLFLGSAESTSMAADLFDPVDKANCIYQSRPAAAAARVAPLQWSGSSARRTTGRQPMPATAPAAVGGQFSYADIHQHELAKYSPPSIVIDADANIVHLSATADRFLYYAAGEPSRSLAALVLPELQLALRTAWFRAMKSGMDVKSSPVLLRRDNKTCAVSVTVHPFHDPSANRDLALVMFQELDQALEQADNEAAGAPGSTPVPADDELLRTREQLQQTLEQAEIANAQMHANQEELQSSIEELHASTEELETSKEELQSTNEELQTVNAELKLRIAETTKVNDDLNNFIVSSDIATIFLDRGMRIQRYTPRINDIFNLIPGDVGRPLMHITNKLDYPRLAEDAARVFETLQPVEQEVGSRDGRYYIMRAQPYRTAEDSIKGAIISFLDISRRHAAELQLLGSEQRQAFLVKLGDATRLQTDPREVQRAAARTLGEHLEVNRVLYAQVEGDDCIVTADRFEFRIPALPGGRYSFRDFAPWTMNELRSGHTGVFQDTRSDPRVSPSERQSCAQLQCTGLVAVPLVKQGRLASLVAVQTAAPRAWTAAEVELIEETARRTREAVEHARAVQALIASEEKYRALFTSIDEGFCVVEMMFDERGNPQDYRFCEINPAFAQQTGLHGAVGRRMRELVPEYEQYWFDIYGKVALTGESIRFENKAQALGRWFDVFAFRYGPPEAHQVAILFTDCTRRKRAEEALHEREKRCREP